MTKPNIILVDDQRDVLTAVRKDLAPLEEYFTLVECESAQESKEVLEEFDAQGEMTALIVCDHIMAHQNGVDFLIELHRDSRFKNTKKILLTGLATHKDTISAINQAKIDGYIEKPWERQEFLHAVKVLLTLFLIHCGDDYQPFLPIMDQETLYQEIKDQT